jgi:hypothetical protein
MRLASPVVVGSVAIVLSGCGSGGTKTITQVSGGPGGSVVVAVTSPASGTVIAGDSVIVTGTVEPKDAEVQIQGKRAAVGNGTFTGTVNLPGGKTTINVVGSSPEETPGTTTVSVTRQGSTRSAGSKGSGGSGSREATPGIAEQKAPSGGGSGQTSCGGGLAVGPDTTCVFAQAVRSAYQRSGGDSTVEAYSVVTRKYYEMTCVRESVVKCTGGIGASVYFP